MPITWETLVKTLKTTRRLYRKAKPEEMMTPVADGYEDISYRVDIDWADVSGMARKAAGNSNKQSRSGPIRVVIVNREEHREAR